MYITILKKNKKRKKKKKERPYKNEKTGIKNEIAILCKQSLILSKKKQYY